MFLDISSLFLWWIFPISHCRCSVKTASVQCLGRLKQQSPHYKNDFRITMVLRTSPRTYLNPCILPIIGKSDPSVPRSTVSQMHSLSSLQLPCWHSSKIGTVCHNFFSFHWRLSGASRLCFRVFQYADDLMTYTTTLNQVRLNSSFNQFFLFL